MYSAEFSGLASKISTTKRKGKGGRERGKRRSKEKRKKKNGRGVTAYKKIGSKRSLCFKVFILFQSCSCLLYLA